MSALRDAHRFYPSVANLKKLGAIDIGTNTIKLLVAAVGTDGTLETILREKSLVRLGTEALAMGRLSGEAITATADTIRTFLRSIEGCGAELGRAVGTCALREAGNAEAFVEEIRRRTGVTIDVISGDEEARLLNLAVRSEFPARFDPLLLVDIGGGSTELVISDGRRVYFSESLPVGAVRLAGRYGKHDPPTREDREAMKKEIRAIARKSCEDVRRVGFATCVGSSGTIQSLSLVHEAAIVGREPAPSGHRTLSRKGLKKVNRLLWRTTTKEKLRIAGLDPRRRDISVPGGILLSWLLKRTGADSIVIGERGLREGVLLDHVARSGRARRPTGDRDVRARSVDRLLRRHNSDVAHGAQVARLAMELFDRTQSLHQLTSAERESLQYGALLHDIGASVGYRKHQRHSYYLITHGGLTGFSEQEIEVLACLARYHRKGLPDESADPWRRLDPYVRPTVEKLIALLRIADGLDRTHRQVVTELACRVGLREVQFRVRSREDCEGELWATRKKANLFERVFDRKTLFRSSEADPEQRVSRRSPLRAVSGG